MAEDYETPPQDSVTKCSTWPMFLLSTQTTQLPLPSLPNTQTSKHPSSASLVMFSKYNCK